ncbi:MAG: diguanylate cyclase [Pirellulaceae bacterium]
MPASKVNILLVDDDPSLLRLLGKWLETAGYETEHAGDGQQAIAAVTSRCPSILVTDWEMPKVDGLALCQWLRRQDLPHYVYTIFLTHRTGSGDIVRALEAGADDFLKKPVDKAELLARVRSGVRILELESRLSLLARTDPLTGLATRRTFHEQAEREWSRSQRHHIPLSCVMVDIDFFKRINDTYGHRVGDQMLQKLTKILKDACRRNDIVCRYGGEEFCVLLPETTEDKALLWAERVRKKVSAQADVIGDPNAAITASFGVAQPLADTESPEQLVDLADQALLMAKRSGRDRVVGFQSIQDSSQIHSTAGGPGALFQGLTAKNVMTTVVAGLNQNETVGRAARFFLRFRFHSAPIVDDDGKLVGILSQRDVMAVMLLPRWWETKTQDVMKRNVVCYEENTSVLVIYEFLCRVSIRGVVIVSDGRPSGMISRTSLLRWFTNLLVVNPSAVLEGPAFNESLANRRCMPPESRDKLTLIVRTLLEEAGNLNNRINDDRGDLIPVVIGGVSRLEELINDLLTASRYAQSVRQEESAKADSTAGWHGTVMGVAELTDAPQLPIPGTSDADRFPPGCGPEVSVDPKSRSAR